LAIQYAQIERADKCAVNTWGTTRVPQTGPGPVCRPKKPTGKPVGKPDSSVWPGFLGPVRDRFLAIFRTGPDREPAEPARFPPVLGTLATTNKCFKNYIFPTQCVIHIKYGIFSLSVLPVKEQKNR
jgi:hypothetical protein